MPRAVWKGHVIAESPSFELVEGNVYFPESAVRKEFLRPSTTTTVCPWKGTAHYYSLDVGGAENKDAVWYYPDPKPAAKNILGHVAFWKGVDVER